MKTKNIFLTAALVAASFTTYAQVGVGTTMPTTGTALHIDGAKDNTTATPTATEVANDVVVTSAGYVGIGTTTPNASAALDVESTTKGFLPPRMTKVQIDAIATPAEGLIVYCTDCSPKGVFVNNGGAFVSMVNPNVPNVPTGVTLLAGEVYSTTGKIWMNKNLGAANAAASSTDYTGYGDLYQWGRAADGHQVVVRNASTLPNATTPAAGSSTSAAGPVASGSEGANFIRNGSAPYDWLSTQNDTRWNSGTESVPVKTANDPCPAGYRVPTETELNAERFVFSSNNSAGAFASPLKLPVAGYRRSSNASLNYVGVNGYYWSSTVRGPLARYLKFYSSYASMYSDFRAGGFSVRCIKE